MSKNIAVQDDANALAIMSDFEQDAHAGFDNMNQEDFALPFLRLLTNTSPEVGEVEGALPGMIYNTVTGELHDGKKESTLFHVATTVSTLNGHHEVPAVVRLAWNLLR